MPWTIKILLVLGVAAIVVLAVYSDSKILYPVLAAGGLFMLLIILAGWDRAIEGRLKARIVNMKAAAGEHLEQGAERAANKSQEAVRGEKDELRTESMETHVPPSPSSELSSFPTFAPDEVEHDESIAEEDLVNDTLCEDTTGHGVDMEDGLFAEGLGVAIELLDLPRSEWGMMTPWGYEVLFAIEAIAAASGQPSQSRELARLRTWSRRVSFNPSPDLVNRMLGLIDEYLEAVRSDPEGCDIPQEGLVEIEREGQRMRDRVEALRAQALR